jgi:serine/threonine protein kinase
LLSDFGFAHIHDASISLTGSAIIGTPAYMAPEQIRGEHVTSLTDQYSLGVVLYQMSTGYLPYEAESPLAVAIKHATEPLPRPRQVNPRLPDAIEAVLVKVLDKDPSRRYKSVSEFNKAFQRSLHSAVDIATGRLKPGAVSRAPTTKVYPLGLLGGIKPKKIWHLKRSIVATLLMLVVALPLAVWLAVAFNAQNQGQVTPTELLRRAMSLGAASEIFPGVISPTTTRRNVVDPSEDPLTGALSVSSPIASLTAGSTPTIDSTANPSPTSTPFTSATSTLSLTPTIKLSLSATPTHTRTPTSTKTPTPSNTPTLTRTRAPFPTEDICANVSLGGFEAHALSAVWTLNNYSSVALAIDSIYLDWPIKNQRLDKVLLSGATIWSDGDEEPPTKMSGVGGMIMPGSSLELDFVFKRAAEVTGYALVVNTGGSCEVSSQD